MLRNTWAPLLLLISTPGCGQEASHKSYTCIQFDMRAVGAEHTFQDKLATGYGLPIYRDTNSSGRSFVRFQSVPPEQITEDTVASLNAAMGEHMTLTQTRSDAAKQMSCDTPSATYSYDQTYEALRNFQRYVAQVIFDHPERFDPQTVIDYKAAYSDELSHAAPTVKELDV